MCLLHVGVGQTHCLREHGVDAGHGAPLVPVVGDAVNPIRRKVATPRLDPAPCMPQNKSGSDVADASNTLPAAVTTRTDSSELISVS